MAAGFHVKLDHDDVAWTLTCGGELDGGAALRLEAAVDLCEQMRPETLHIDARDLSFVDGAGISALILCARRCTEDGIGFSVALSEQGRAVLEHGGVAERLLLGRAAVPAT